MISINYSSGSTEATKPDIGCLRSTVVLLLVPKHFLQTHAAGLNEHLTWPKTTILRLLLVGTFVPGSVTYYKYPSKKWELANRPQDIGTNLQCIWMAVIFLLSKLLWWFISSYNLALQICLTGLILPWYYDSIYFLKNSGRVTFNFMRK